MRTKVAGVTKSLIGIALLIVLENNNVNLFWRPVLSCNFGLGNLGVGNFGMFNVGVGNKGFLNMGILSSGFANLFGLRTIGAMNVAPIPNTISVLNIPVAPNLSPPVGRKRRKRRSTMKYPDLMRLQQYQQTQYNNGTSMSFLRKSEIQRFLKFFRHQSSLKQ